MISDSLQKAIDEKKLMLVRSNLEWQIGFDRNVKTFTLLESADYAESELKKSGVELFVEDDGEYTSVEQSKWDKDFWEELRIAVVYNFSRLKLQRIAEVMEYLRSQGHPDFQVDETVKDTSDTKIQPVQPSSREQKSASSPKDKTNRKYVIGGVAGAIVGGVGGKLFGFSVAGLAAGVAVGLVTVYLQNKKR